MNNPDDDDRWRAFHARLITTEIVGAIVGFFAGALCGALIGLLAGPGPAIAGAFVGALLGTAAGYGAGSIIKYVQLMFHETIRKRNMLPVATGLVVAVCLTITVAFEKEDRVPLMILAFVIGFVLGSFLGAAMTSVRRAIRRRRNTSRRPG